VKIFPFGFEVITAVWLRLLWGNTGNLKRIFFKLLRTETQWSEEYYHEVWHSVSESKDLETPSNKERI